MQMQQAVQALFDRYERSFNDALTAEPDLDAIADLYTDTFIAASPAGIVSGNNDDQLKKAMTDGFVRYRKMGTKQMQLRHLRVVPIDPLHGLAHVEWRAIYDIEGAQKMITFTNVYLVRIENDKGKVFGWITGDEDAELKKHGIT
ncbi:nuclear transport factor 2 family protein [Bordetella sp. BOR01]|uniref:nuclear transport factor 2 family protein n=1 Tax=Bordetella sp. BOR01 TaxID=2854779 RepID=UPI001C459E24|nr:nuclear transport factor 2 family protein [Bordetella sp. BOR01]MBV7481491.1 nuclear transport factor 2 family protein [Bordetella sp. BOR01]